MKKLFDEIYEMNRTIWYLSEESGESINDIFSEPDEYGGRTITPSDYTTLANTIKKTIYEDLKNDSEKEVVQTNWIFYSSIIANDAIGDKVRFSIFIRLINKQYICNINASDFIFVTSLDEVIKIKEIIEFTLNQNEV